MTVSNKSDHPDSLRAAAEALCAKEEVGRAKHSDAQSGGDEQPRPVKALLHSLQVHQIELEMQNDTLRRKQLELETSRNRYVDLYDFAPVGYLTLNSKELISDVNLTATKLLGVTRKQLLKRRLAAFVATEHLGRWHRYFMRALQHVEPSNIELVFQHGDSSAHYIRLDCRSMETEGEPTVRIALTDISEQKQLQEALKQRVDEVEKSRQSMLFMLEDLNASKDQIERGKKEWEATFDAVKHPIFLHDSEGKIVRANRVYAKKAGMPLAQCIGRLFWKVFPKTESRPEYCNPDAMSSVPVAEGVEITDGDLCYMVYMHPIFDENNVSQFSIHVMEDITRRKLNSHELKRRSMLLSASLQGAIQALSNAVEIRDPYTAGHQKGVSKLAVALARQMHLDADRICGIELGALIHDIGKVAIPAEILCKPGKLSSLECRLIKEHPEVGIGILKVIDFPWPVAEIAHQHHERLDGSGYPQGLKAEAICLEARIVAVADVVEAMLSHRPYHDALSLEAVMDEISRNSGKLYDPAVAGACLAVFAGGFQL